MAGKLLVSMSRPFVRMQRVCQGFAKELEGPTFQLFSCSLAVLQVKATPVSLFEQDVDQKDDPLNHPNQHEMLLVRFRMILGIVF